MKPILEIQHISKKFRINHEQQPYLSLRDSLSAIFKSKKTTEDFWALKDLSFNVEQGDTIGIIGKNGAGKSTLLKILSKITPPTSGKIICRGRIASLLEVGTGFHPELSGRENIFMNGSILGMRKTEILKNFDAIVDFAGVEKFIDTPLKHYSSGMQLRLAFAVAAFLENEILIIDEVLAVGDSEFQKKCMVKMGEVSNSGRTILFVSHNLAAIQSLCKKGVFLEKGKMKQCSSIDEVIRNYHFDGLNSLTTDLKNLGRVGYKSNQFFFTKIELLSGTTINEGDKIKFRLDFETYVTITNLGIGFSLTDHLNANLIECRSYNETSFTTIEESGSYYVDFEFQINLREGIYSMNIGSKSNEGFLDAIQSVLLIEVKSKFISTNTLLSEPSSIGYLLTDSKWKFSNIK